MAQTKHPPGEPLTLGNMRVIGGGIGAAVRFLDPT
jgi:hypothetical protein